MSYKALTQIILGLILSLSFLGSSKAAAQCCPGYGFEGFYVGDSIGYLASRAEYTYQMFEPIDDHFNTHVNVNGLDIGVHGGWGTVFETCVLGPLYIGVEPGAFAIYAKGKKKSNWFDSLDESEDLFLDQKVRLRNSFQIAARIGFPVYYLLPYFKCGWNSAKWEFSHKELLLGPGPDILSFIEEDKQLGAILWGVGMEVKTIGYPNILWGFEWTYSRFDRQTLHVGESDFSLHSTIKLRPTYSRVGFRLSYLF
jgi:hypothetical protein